MAIEEISRIPVGDMMLVYEQETDLKTVGFYILPLSMNDEDNKKKKVLPH